MALPSAIIQRGTRAAQPTPNSGQAGILYYVTDETKLERWSGTAWESYSLVGAGTGDVVGPASSTDNAVVRFDGTTGKLIQNTSVVTLSDTGAFTLPDDVRQTFNPGTNAAGLNVGALAGNPGTPSDGDIWYNSTTNRLMTRVNGTICGIDGWLEEQTPTGTGTLTFSTLGSFTHLEIVWSARSTQAATTVEVAARFNADTGGNYDYELGYTAATTIAAAEGLAQTSALVGTLAAASATAGRAGGGTIWIPDYRGTTFNKIITSLSYTSFGTSSSNLTTRFWGAGWRSTSAITSITLLLSAGNYDSGSKFTLYGRS